MNVNRFVQYFLLDCEEYSTGPQNIFIKDNNLRYIACNHTSAEVLQLSSPAKIVGKTDHELLEYHLAESVNYVDKKILTSKKGCVIPEIGIDKDGNYTIYLSHKMPFYHDGNVAGIIGFSINTKEKMNKDEFFNLLNLQHNLYGFALYLHVNFSSIKLSIREVECLFHLVNGNTSKEIAKIMKIYPSTVDTYLNNLKIKLNCKNRLQLLAKIFSFENKYL